jgi:hypothetical protein
MLNQRRLQVLRKHNGRNIVCDEQRCESSSTRKASNSKLHHYANTAVSSVLKESALDAHAAAYEFMQQYHENSSSYR